MKKNCPYNKIKKIAKAKLIDSPVAKALKKKKNITKRLTNL